MEFKLSRSFFSAILFLACAALLLMGMMQAAPVQACQHDDAAEDVAFQVILGPLRIRDAPGGETVGMLLVGESVTVTEYAEADNYLWGRHELGWSALNTLDCAVEYAEHTDAMPADTAAGDDAADDGAAPPAGSGGAAPPAGGAADPPPPGAALRNLCNTVWTFCNSGTPEQNAYFWRLGWYTVAIESGELAVPPGTTARDLVAPEATAEP